jgi:hypothetical protein
VGGPALRSVTHWLTESHSHSIVRTGCRGTVVLQAVGLAEQKPIGLVLRTGFNSAKGHLVQSMLYPKEPEVTNCPWHLPVMVSSQGATVASTSALHTCSLPT